MNHNCGAGVAIRRYPTSMVRSGGHEEIPQVQGKRNPSKMVGVLKEHQRADTLKPESKKTTPTDHREHSLA